MNMPEIVIYTFIVTMVRVLLDGTTKRGVERVIYVGGERSSQLKQLQELESVKLCFLQVKALRTAVVWICWAVIVNP